MGDGIQKREFTFLNWNSDRHHHKLFVQASYKFIDDKCGDQLSYHQYADTSIIELWGQCNSASSVPIEGESHIKKSYRECKQASWIYLCRSTSRVLGKHEVIKLLRKTELLQVKTLQYIWLDIPFCSANMKMSYVFFSLRLIIKNELWVFYSLPI